MANDTNQVDVKFGAQTDEIDEGVDHVNSKLGDIGEGLDGLKEGLDSFAAAFATVFATDKLEEFARSMSDVGEQIERMTRMTGMSAEGVQQFQNAVAVMGGDAESAGMSLIRLERNVADAAQGIGNSAQAFQRLGVSMNTLKSGDVSAVLAEMADQLERTADGANKTSAMLEVAGRGGAQLIPILDGGRQGLEALQEAVGATGVTLSEDLIEKFSASAEAIKLMDMSSKALHQSLYAALEPALDAVAAGLTSMNENATKSIDSGSGLADVMHFLGAVIDGVVAAVDALATAFKALFDVAVGIGKGIVDAFEGVGKAIYDLAHGNLTKAISDYDEQQSLAFSDLKKGFTDAGSEGTKFWGDMTRMMQAYNGESQAIVPKQAKGHKPQIAAPVDKAGQDKATSDEAALLGKERQGYMEAYTNKKTYDELQVESGKMSHDEMYADLKAELDKEHDAVDQSFDQQAALYATDSAKYNQVMQDKANADARFANEKTRLDLEASKESAKQWTSAFNTIEKSLDQMLQGVLQGTQTMGQMFQRLAQSLVLSLGEAALKMGLDWLKMEAQKTAASIAGNQVRATSQAEATAQGAAMQSSANSESILKDASGAAAGTFNSVAQIPYVGWILAPIAAGAAFAAVAAFDSFDVGTPNVPRDMLAQIHQGEAIVPARQAQKWRDGDLGIGGGNSQPDVHTHFHISSLDSAGVSKMMQKHSSAIGAAVAQAARGGSGPMRAAFNRM